MRATDPQRPFPEPHPAPDPAPTPPLPSPPPDPRPPDPRPPIPGPRTGAQPPFPTPSRSRNRRSRNRNRAARPAAGAGPRTGSSTGPGSRAPRSPPPVPDARARRHRPPVIQLPSSRVFARSPWSRARQEGYEHGRRTQRSQPEQSPERASFSRRRPDHSFARRRMIEDRRNWPGIILAAVGIVLVALTLTAAGYGFAGWAVIAGIIGVICLIAVDLSWSPSIGASSSRKARPCGNHVATDRRPDHSAAPLIEALRDYQTSGPLRVHPARPPAGSRCGRASGGGYRRGRVPRRCAGGPGSRRPAGARSVPAASPTCRWRTPRAAEQTFFATGGFAVGKAAMKVVSGGNEHDIRVPEPGELQLEIHDAAPRRLLRAHRNGAHRGGGGPDRSGTAHAVSPGHFRHRARRAPRPRGPRLFAHRARDRDERPGR